MHINKKNHLVAFFSFLVFSFNSYAQANNSVMIDDSLAVSLTGLRNSTEEVISRNQWLESEIDQYQMKIKELEDDLEGYQFLENNKNYPNINVLKQQRSISNQNIDSTEKNQNEVEKKIDFAESNYGELKVKIMELSQSNQDLNAKIQELDKMLTEKKSPLSAQKEELLASLKVAQENSIQSNNQIDQLNRNYGRPLTKFLELMDRNKILKDQDFELKKKILESSKEQIKIQQDLGLLEKSSVDQMKILNDQIVSLKDKKESLTNLLERARNKLKNKDITSKSKIKEFEGLEDNLSVIKQENSYLKDQLAGLQDQLKTSSKK